MLSTLDISLIQTSLFWENKQENIKLLMNKINGLKEQSHIIVLPEMFTTGFSMNPAAFAESMHGDTILWLQEISRKKKSIVTGSIIIEENSNDTIKYYNRLVWMQPDGKYGYYDKRHLFGYAGEDKHYTAGHQRIIFSVGGWKILPLICYDLRFPVWSRQQSENGNPEYDILLYVANWPAKRSHAWRSLLIARAIENQCYVVAVNRIGNDGNNIPHEGHSMVVDPLGDILFDGKDEEITQTLSLSRSHLEKCRQQFPFLKDADYFKLLNG